MTWEERIAELWSSMEDYPEDEFVQRVDALADELPAPSAIALFEKACARSMGNYARALLES